MQTLNSSSINTMTQLNGTDKYIDIDIDIDIDSNHTDTQKIRISIVDDSQMIREGLKIMLETEPDFEVVGTAKDGKTAIKLVETQKPDIVLMDMEMPELNGISSTEIICERFSNTKVVVLSSHSDHNYITQSILAGAKGYFLKETPLEDIVHGLKYVNKGFCQFSPGLLESYAGHTAELKAAESNAREDFQLASETDETSISPAEPEPIIEFDRSNKPKWLQRIAIVATLSLVVLAICAWAIAKFNPNLFNQIVGTEPAPITPAPEPTPTAVSALGQIEPEGEIIELSVSSAAESSKVEKLLVKRGDKVKQGQVVAVLDRYDRASTEVDRAQTDVSIAQANLERIRAGAKQGDISAQEAAISRLEAELRGQVASQKAALSRLTAELENAQVEYNRYQQLFEDGAISAQERDTRRLRVDTVGQQLAEAKETLNRTIETTSVQRNEAQARLESIAEVRSVDVQVAQAELEQAQAAVKQAKAELALTEVRSPIDGRILKVNVRPGEVVGNRGIVEIGQTDRMYVMAEVYETDVDKIRLGQKAIVTGSAFQEELEGEVAQIGLEVRQQDVFESDPLVNTDNKVVEVKIRLSPESSKRVTALSNLQVQVVIVL